MIRGILKALFVGWVAKKFINRNNRHDANAVGGAYPDRRA